MLPDSYLFGFLWPKYVLRTFTSEACTFPGHNMSEVRAIIRPKYGEKHVLRRVINMAKVCAPTLLGYVKCNYPTYVLLTVSEPLQQLCVVSQIYLSTHFIGIVF